jgi:hypothetical protein
MVSFEIAKGRSRFELASATEADEAELRGLLRRIPVEGSIRVAFEREPDFFAAASLQGPFHQVGIVRDRETGRIVGMGTRSIAEAFVNGEPMPLGYLSDLRLLPEYRNGSLVARGYRMLREWHHDARTEMYYTVIFANNHDALDTIAQQRAGLPAYHDCGRLHCPGINLRRRKADLDLSGEILRGDSSLLPQIIDCLNRNNARKQFAPYHRIEDFLTGGRWIGFHPQDFYLARNGGRITGVLGKWDLRHVKQSRVVGYRGPLKYLRPLLQLPKPGEVLPFFYVSFVAIDDDDLETFSALLRRLYNDHVGSEYRYFLIAFHERDKLRNALADYRLTHFEARLFCVSFDGASWPELDDRCPYIELATL